MLPAFSRYTLVGSISLPSFLTFSSIVAPSFAFSPLYRSTVLIHTSFTNSCFSFFLLSCRVEFLTPPAPFLVP
ncbi:hypothetical protein V8F06_001223 [Rhypophila decipiens]